MQKCCELLLNIVASQSASKDQLATAAMSNTVGVDTTAGQQRQLQLIQCSEYNVLSYVVNLLITCLQVCHVTGLSLSIVDS